MGDGGWGKMREKVRKAREAYGHTDRQTHELVDRD